MNWCPLENSKIEKIAKMIDYSGQNMGARELYQKMADISYSIEDKVKFILQHWGWNGNVNAASLDIIATIQRSGFCIPQNVLQIFQQLYGLSIPMKTKSLEDKYGFTLCFFMFHEWSDEMPFSECLSAKYNDTIFPIGFLVNYNGWQQKNPNCWENPTCSGDSCDESGLYLGSNENIYSMSYAYPDRVYLWSNSIVNFFANAFGLTSPLRLTYDEMTDTDFDLADKIDGLNDKGEYHQNQFWKGTVPYSEERRKAD